MMDRIDPSEVGLVFDEADSHPDTLVTRDRLRNLVRLSILGSRYMEDGSALAGVCVDAVLVQAGLAEDNRGANEHILNRFLSQDSYRDGMLRILINFNSRIQQNITALLKKILKEEADNEEILNYFSSRVIQAALNTVIDVLRGETVVVEESEVFLELPISGEYELNQLATMAEDLYASVLTDPSDTTLVRRALGVCRRLLSEYDDKRTDVASLGPGMSVAYSLLRQYHHDVKILLGIILEHGTYEFDLGAYAYRRVLATRIALGEMREVFQMASGTSASEVLSQDSDGREGVHFEVIDGGIDAPPSDEEVATLRNGFAHLQLVQLPDKENAAQGDEEDDD